MSIVAVANSIVAVVCLVAFARTVVRDVGLTPLRIVVDAFASLWHALRAERAASAADAAEPSFAQAQPVA